MVSIFKTCAATAAIATTLVSSSCAVPFFGGCKLESDDYVKATEFKNDSNPKVELKVTGQVFIDKPSIYPEGHGIINIQLFPSVAPITVENFLMLVESNFYDGLTFHRIDDLDYYYSSGQYVIQGGDPEGDGSGGSDETIKGEFCSNDVTNNVSHTRGAISMARSGDSNDSASSQFFFVQSRSGLKSLDGNYAAFGVVEGTNSFNVLDTLVGVEVDSNGKPKSKITIEYIKVVQQ